VNARRARSDFGEDSNDGTGSVSRVLRANAAGRGKARMRSPAGAVVKEDFPDAPFAMTA
jgi:hypothetical protein